MRHICHVSHGALPKIAQIRAARVLCCPGAADKTFQVFFSGLTLVRFGGTGDSSASRAAFKSHRIASARFVNLHVNRKLSIRSRSALPTKKFRRFFSGGTATFYPLAHVCALCYICYLWCVRCIRAEIQSDYIKRLAGSPGGRALRVAGSARCANAIASDCWHPLPAGGPSFETPARAL